MNLSATAGVVTGAASGLGRATAERLAATGARLVLLDLDGERLAALAASLPGDHVIAPADVRDPDGVRRSIADGIAAFRELRFVVNCAGVPSAAKVVSNGIPHDLELWDRVIGINLTGTSNVARLVAQAMVANAPDADGQRGVIVNTSSIAAFDGVKGQVAYAASKAAVAGMTLPIARDLAAHGIRCVDVAPGLFETELTASLPAKGREAMERNLLFPGRTGRPDEFASVVMAVLTNPYVNATCYRVDGGARLAPS